MFWKVVVIILIRFFVFQLQKQRNLINNVSSIHKLTTPKDLKVNSAIVTEDVMNTLYHVFIPAHVDPLKKNYATFTRTAEISGRFIWKNTYWKK